MNEDRVSVVLEAVSQKVQELDRAAEKIDQITEASKRNEQALKHAEKTLETHRKAVDAVSKAEERATKATQKSQRVTTDNVRIFDHTAKAADRAAKAIDRTNKAMAYSGKPNAFLGTDPNAFFAKAMKDADIAGQKMAKTTKALTLATTQQSTAAAKAATATQNATKAVNAATAAKQKASGAGLNYSRIWQAVSAAVIAATTALSAFAFRTLRNTDQLTTHAKLLGTTVEKYQQLRVSAELGTRSPGQLFQTVQQLNRAMAESQKPGSEAENVFRRLGISARDAAGNMRDPIDVLYEISDAFASSEGAAAKAQYAQILFGRSNVEMIDFLDQGSGAIKRQAIEAQGLGAIFSQEVGEQATRLSDNIDVLKTALLGLANSVFAQIVPSLLELTDEIIRIWKEGNATTEGTALLVSIFRTLTQTAIIATGVLRVLGIVIGQGVALIVSNTLAIIDGLVRSFKNLVESVRATIAAFSNLGNVFTQIQQRNFSGAAEEGRRALADIGKAMLGIGGAVADGLKTQAETVQSTVQNLISGTKDATVEAIRDIQRVSEQTAAMLDATTGDAVRKAEQTRAAISGGGAGGTGGRRQLSPLGQEGTFGQELGVGFNNFVRDLGSTSRLAAATIQGTLGNAINGITSGIQGLVMGTQSWGQAMAQTGLQIINALIAVGVEMLAVSAIRAAIGAATTTQAASEGAAITASMTPAAVVTGAATMGTGTAIGVALTIAAIIAAIAALSGAFAEGGIVPGSPSRKDNRLAAVATGELIVSALATQSLKKQVGMGGIGMLMRGQVPPGFVSGGVAPRPSAAIGFATGGIVGAGASAGARASTDISISLVQVRDRNEEREALARDASAIFIDRMNRRGNKLQA